MFYLSKLVIYKNLPSYIMIREEPSAPPPPVAAATVVDGRMAVETTASQATLEPSAGVGSGGADVVVVPSDED
jgi:hypothetical protein